MLVTENKNRQMRGIQLQCFSRVSGTKMRANKKLKELQKNPLTIHQKRFNVQNLTRNQNSSVSEKKKTLLKN